MITALNGSVIALPENNWRDYMKQHMIVILDLGSRENTRIARLVRDLGVYSEIYPHDITEKELEALPNVKGIIVNG